jgi:hypothetical protein
LDLPKAIQPDEIREIMRKQLPDSTPGIDGLPNRFFRILGKPFVDIMTALIEACWKQGYHPRRFKKARTVALRKPNKRNYGFPKVWKSIALLNTVGKLIEAAIAKRLHNAVETHILFSDFQIGVRFNRFMEIVFEFLTE